jgi:hypothetical protein
MSVKYLLPAVLVSLLAGCASSGARKDGNFPPSEADYVYPNWVKSAAPRSSSLAAHEASASAASGKGNDAAQ